MQQNNRFSAMNKVNPKGKKALEQDFLVNRKALCVCTANECITKIRENLPTIQNEYGVTGLTLFGSVARGDNTPESDVDLLVEMPPKFLAVCRLHEYLENLLNVSVDLIHRHSRMNPRFLNEVARDGITIL